MAGFFSDFTFKDVLNFAGDVIKSKKPSTDPAYTAEVTKSASYPQVQSNKILMYMGMAGMGLILVMVMMKK